MINIEGTCHQFSINAQNMNQDSTIEGGSMPLSSNSLSDVKKSKELLSSKSCKLKSIAFYLKATFEKKW